MQYLVSVIDDESGSATSEEMTAVRAFNDRLREEGHWVFAGGLAAPSSATVIDDRDGRGIVTDGPFVESKEYCAGLWILEAPDLDVAMRLAAQGSRSCHRRVELRPLLG
ncbi:YciI family protein [Nocardioides lijunqiniae]|uniref:YciI family protein n=1 Tax=Nocardioides lijunqiniae TaxID=2760832 RepID=UPI001877F7D3|nr:YciI family protein [Nocardioides lijunqiniae]